MASWLATAGLLAAWSCLPRAGSKPAARRPHENPGRASAPHLAATMRLRWQQHPSPYHHRRLGLALIITAACSFRPVQGIDNGIGVTPPMVRPWLCTSPSLPRRGRWPHLPRGLQGWRHWKAFYAHINQDIMEAIMEEMARKYPVDGVPTSLADLGYKYVGLGARFPHRSRGPLTGAGLHYHTCSCQKLRLETPRQTTTGRTARQCARTAPSSPATRWCTRAMARAATTTSRA
jgi:hypothetical protein